MLGGAYTSKLSRVVSEARGANTLGKRLQHILGAPALWVSFVYWILVKFLLGMVNFIVALVCLLLGPQMMVHPIVNNACESCAKNDSMWGWTAGKPWTIPLFLVAGFFVFVVCLHIVRALAPLNHFVAGMIGEVVDNSEQISMLGSDGIAAGATEVEVEPMYTPAATYTADAAAPSDNAPVLAPNAIDSHKL